MLDLRRPVLEFTQDFCLEKNDLHNYLSKMTALNFGIENIAGIFKMKSTNASIFIPIFVTGHLFYLLYCFFSRSPTISIYISLGDGGMSSLRDICILPHR